MPKTDYTKTIIYKIINHEYPELIYVGSTTNFKSRKSTHKCKCNNPKSDRHHLKCITRPKMIILNQVELELIHPQMAQQPCCGMKLARERCACGQCRESQIERGGMDERGCARRLGEWVRV